MESHGIINDNSNKNPHSHRFLANFTLFLVQPCSNLDLEVKCQLISEYIARISTSFIEEALHWVEEEGNEEIENAMPSHSGDKQDIYPSQDSFHEAATVGLEAMHRANSTLEDFCRSYFMFHKMDVHHPQSIFRYLPILSFTESYIYQLDTLNEKLLRSPTYGVQFGEISDMVCQTKQGWEIRSLKMLEADPFRPLVILLEHQGLFTERIREELRSGVEYWTLERKLCCPHLTENKITVGDVMRAISLKSFDYRVLNLLLYQLRGEKVNELHMEFLSISEFLVEISDDLFDYEDDVLENNFNILRMFVRIYGASSTAMMLAKYITEAEEKYEKLLEALDPDLSMIYQKRCEEATKEGGKILGPALGTWNIPAIIEDEDSYRCKILNIKPSTAVQADVDRYSC
ncbi:hypothetical protein ACH5RR_013150 [Cinchona calisaya]|uniref:Uncharacterized protein n=1 Tax=Cinchona calisaya TaxID=153742 RepID=A0ABD3A4Y3_9GENT